ncbi:MAG: flippase-like domain-containing protein [Planctomycetes bacterium]|nr:flippase-like domain-containing protein [Planctomycetota bacterium]
MTGAAARGSVLSRLLPALKALVAAALVAFVVWIVPFRDRLTLAAGEAQEEHVFSGTIVARDGSRVLFECDGKVLDVLLEGTSGFPEDSVVQVTLPAGEVLRLAPRHPPEPPAGRLEEGILTVAKNADVRLFAVALLCVFAATLIATYRWYRLLLGATLSTTFGRAFNLTLIGLFFNFVMPGLTGGDLVKAVYVARDHRGKVVDALLTLLADRALGITGLALVAALVIPVNLDEYAGVAPWIYGFLALEAACVCLFFSQGVRRALRIDALLARLPLAGALRAVDQAILLYRTRTRLMLLLLLLSMGVHLFVVSGFCAIGAGIALDVPRATYFAVVPICLIAMALPLAPSGFGVGEMAFVYFWSAQGVSSSRALALALVYRMVQLAVSLGGGISLALQKERVSAGEAERLAANGGRGP